MVHLACTTRGSTQLVAPFLIATGSQKRQLAGEPQILEKASLGVIGAQPVTGREEAVL